MVINFSQLVENIEQRNQQDRQRIVSQIAPLLEVSTRKSIYESEKARAKQETSEGLATVAKSMGVDYVPNVGLSPELQNMDFSAQADRQKPIQQMEAFANMYGIPLPDNYKNMKPEQAILTFAKMRDEHDKTEVITTNLSLYPEIAAKLLRDDKYRNADTNLKFAMLEKERAAAGAESKMADELELYRRKSEQDVIEYRATTGATAAANRAAASQGTPTESSLNKQAIASKLTSGGMMFGSHNVKIEQQEGGQPIARLRDPRGNQFIKTAEGIFSWNDKKNKWAKIAVKTEGTKVTYSAKGNNIKGSDDIPYSIIKSLNEGYEAYEKSTLRDNIKTTLQPTQDFSANDEYFQEG